ncbi:calcium-binding protein [Amaricoccus solimangrovi]|uniref:Calcium-binding protein n=1 Tax=Amaricoccus solimangrovi TaxID=2589815 RepID=A0A501WLX0_9RHOB|nr:calcium-binding protein [Amaricoccus solimangrovi]TPE49154.1 calcium-binding protein [Amaricoccus solimangrovi]
MDQQISSGALNSGVCVMVAFSSNGTFRSGTAINRWDESITANLAGMRSRGNNLPTLLDDGTHLLSGDGQNEAMIYDLSLGGQGNSFDGSFQRFANTFTEINLAGGNDLLDLTVNPSRGVPNYTQSVTAIGDSGNDTLWTGYGNDTVYGDTVNSALISIDLFRSGFDDMIHGGDGNDEIYGDFGSLALANVSIGAFALGSDTLHGGNDNDVIYGDYDNSSFVSVSVSALSFGDDLIQGDAGNDILYGDIRVLGAISISANALSFGSDTIYGGDGDDTIYGDPGASGVGLGLSLNILSFVADELHGGAGADTLVGDSAGNLPSALAGGDDALYGDGGADVIVGDYTGDLGTLITTLNFGDDMIEGGDGADILVGDYRSTLGLTAANLLSFGDDEISGGAGNDTIYGDTSNSAITGLGAGSDTITGGAGNDVLWGDYPVALNLLGLAGGSDTFVFAPGSGADTIADFHKHALLNLQPDTIDVSAYGITGMNGLSITYSNGDATIDLGGGDTILVQGPDVLSGGALGNPLTASDFIFA